MSIKIMVVDDHGIMRAGLELLIEQQDDMEIIGQAVNGREAVEKAEKLKPDVILMDVSLPDLNGIDATAKILKNQPNTKVIALSAYSNRRFVTDILKAGACGYVVKDCVTEELIRAIKTVYAGERYLCSKAAKILIDNFIDKESGSGESGALSKLTTRERELMQLVVEGKSAKQIARILNKSIKTVDGRRRTIMDKLDMDSLTELTKFAIRQGLTSVDF